MSVIADNLNPRTVLTTVEGDFVSPQRDNSDTVGSITTWTRVAPESPLAAVPQTAGLVSDHLVAAHQHIASAIDAMYRLDPLVPFDDIMREHVQALVNADARTIRARENLGLTLYSEDATFARQTQPAAPHLSVVPDVQAGA